MCLSKTEKYAHWYAPRCKEVRKDPSVDQRRKWRVWQICFISITASCFWDILRNLIVFCFFFKALINSFWEEDRNLDQWWKSGQIEDEGQYTFGNDVWKIQVIPVLCMDKNWKLIFHPMSFQRQRSIYTKLCLMSTHIATKRELQKIWTWKQTKEEDRIILTCM